MALCKLPCTVLIDQKFAVKQAFQRFIVLYSMVKELAYHEVTDPSVSFNGHTSSIGLKQHRHFLDHVIFKYIKNWLAMTSKMAARVLAIQSSKSKKTSRRRSSSHP